MVVVTPEGSERLGLESDVNALLQRVSVEEDRCLRHGKCVGCD